MRRSRSALCLLAAAACVAASSAGAHGFGERYDLPLPFTLYLYGAAGAIVLSLIALVLLVQRAPARPERPPVDLLTYPVGRAALILCAPIRLATLLLLALTIVAGFLGDQSPYKNIAPTLVWIIFWVGMTFASALIGNVWDALVAQRTTAEPSRQIAGVAVPPDALLPDADGRLQPVGAGRVAKTKLTFRLLGSAFHDGTRTSVADLIYSYAFAYRWGARADGKPARDVEVDAATARLRRDLVGFEVVGVDTGSKSFRVGEVNFVRELFTVDVYANVSPQDPERENAIAPPWSTVPWHVLALMDEAVGGGYAAFSRAEAVRKGVQWLDLVRSAPLRERLAALVAGFERDGFRPDALRAQVSEEDARKRWAALAAFFKEHGHFLATNGPYRLKRWSADSVTLEAFRDLTYPLGVGSYDAYAVPRRGFVAKVDLSEAGATISGDIEVVEKFQRSYRLVRTALVALPREVARRAAPECRYTVVDEQARVVLAGVAPLTDNATFEIDFRGRLPPGRYTLFAAIALVGNVMNADIKRIPVTVSAGQ